MKTKAKKAPKRKVKKVIVPEVDRPIGKPKSIETPEMLDEYFQQYKAWVKANPRKVHDFVGGFAKEVYKKKDRPLTWSGFESWLSVNRIICHLGHYEQNKDGGYTEYLPIIRAIKVECRADVIDGALSGIYNANIAARLEGLKENINANIQDDRKAVADLFPPELDG